MHGVEGWVCLQSTDGNRKDFGSGQAAWDLQDIQVFFNQESDLRIHVQLPVVEALRDDRVLSRRC